MASTMTSPQSSAGVLCTVTGGLAPAVAASNVSHQVASSPTVGSGSGNVNKVYSAPFTVVAGTPTTVDLNSTTDPLGAAIVFTNMQQAIISVDSGASSPVIPWGGTNGVFASSTQDIKAGGSLHINGGTDGWTIDGTHKIVQLTTLGVSVPGKLTIIGK